MARLAALFTSDASLVRCELARIKAHVQVEVPGLVMGVGAYQEEQIIHRRFAAEGPRVGAWDVPDTEVVLLHAGRLPLGEQLEDVGQPFRLRRWLFAQVGEVDRPRPTRERLLEELPEHLQTWMKGPSLGEAMFGAFLAELRGLGRTDDPSLPAVLAAEALSRTARRVEHASADGGATFRPRQALVATNGRVLVAARLGDQPLAWTLLEGTPTCARCGLTGAPGEPEARVRDHSRRRTVVLATHPVGSLGWVPVPDGGAVAVERSLAVTALASG